LASLLGQHKSELIEIYGYPENSSMILEVDGKTIFNYKTQRNNKHCLLSLEFNNNVFSRYWYYGSNCRKPASVHHGSLDKKSKEKEEVEADLLILDDEK